MPNAPGRQVDPKFGGGSFWDKVLLQNAAAPDLGQYLGTPSEEDMSYGDGTIVKPKGIQAPEYPPKVPSEDNAGIAPMMQKPTNRLMRGADIGFKGGVDEFINAGAQPAVPSPPPVPAVKPPPPPAAAVPTQDGPPAAAAAAVPPAEPPSAGTRTAEAIAKLTGRDTDTSGTSDTHFGFAEEDRPPGAFYNMQAGMTPGPVQAAILERILNSMGRGLEGGVDVANYGVKKALYPIEKFFTRTGPEDEKEQEAKLEEIRQKIFTNTGNWGSQLYNAMQGRSNPYENVVPGEQGWNTTY
jgi:hypothetical protein